MKFKVSRRLGHFLHLNVRNERHGDEKVPAADIKIEFPGTKRDLDMLLPLQDGKMSDVLYDDKGNLMTPYLSPLKVFRKPENVTMRIWDRTSEKDFLEFEGTTIKGIEMDLNDKRNLLVRLTIQVHDDPEKHTARLRRLMDAERDFSLEAQQEDFFDQDPDEEETESAQGEMPVDEEQDDFED